MRSDDRRRAPYVTLDDMQADTPPHLCPLCHDELPPSRGPRARRICGAPECVTAYQRLYRRAYRRRATVTVSNT